MSGLKRPGPGLFSDGPNARSKTVTVADGDDTYGVSVWCLHRANINLDVSVSLSVL
jgi:hypothetical protein